MSRGRLCKKVPSHPSGDRLRAFGKAALGRGAPLLLGGLILAAFHFLTAPNAADAGDEAAARREKKMVLKTGFAFDELFLKHDTGPGHPERPQRLKAIVEYLEKAKLRGDLFRVECPPASAKWLQTIHTAAYIEEVEKHCQTAQPRFIHSRDTVVSRDSFTAALRAAGGVLKAIDAVMERKVRNAFCAVRPPGHHALKNRAMGFCLFNNVAIAARYIQQKHKLAKVLIVDWDVHHGNGTQAAFYDDPTVLYFSVHRYPFYPGSGSEKETGEGKGEGYTLNAPLPAGSGDKEFLEVFEQKLKPAALKFRPDFVLISAGFDAHENDPLGGMKLTADGYAKMTRLVKDIAAKCCQGRLVSVLEGGYDLAGLAESVAAHIRALRE